MVMKKKKKDPLKGKPQTWRLGSQVFTDVKEFRAAESAARATTAPTGGVVTEKGKKAAEEFKAARAKYTPQVLSPFERSKALEAEKIKAEERKTGFAEETGSDILRKELEEKIAAPPTMEPEPITELPATEKAAELGLRGAGIALEAVPFIKPLKDMFTLATGKKFSNEKMAKTKLGKALGLTALGAGAATGIGLAAYFTVPAVTAFTAKTVVGKAVLGKAGSVPFLKTAVTGLGIFVVGRSIFDWRGDEMDNLRSGLKKVVEDGERIEAAVRNGYPTEDSIEVLSTMADEVSSAERRIKELGIKNLNYRVSKEYILDQQNVRSSREAILRRVLAIENMAARGQAALSPQELLFDLAQFEK